MWWLQGSDFQCSGGSGHTSPLSESVSSSKGYASFLESQQLVLDVIPPNRVVLKTKVNKFSTLYLLIGGLPRSMIDYFSTSRSLGNAPSSGGWPALECCSMRDPQLPGIHARYPNPRIPPFLFWISRIWPHSPQRRWPWPWGNLMSVGVLLRPGTLQKWAEVLPLSLCLDSMRILGNIGINSLLLPGWSTLLWSWKQFVCPS